LTRNVVAAAIIIDRSWVKVASISIRASERQARNKVTWIHWISVVAGSWNIATNHRHAAHRWSAWIFDQTKLTWREDASGDVQEILPWYKWRVIACERQNTNAFQARTVVIRGVLIVVRRIRVCTTWNFIRITDSIAICIVNAIAIAVNQRIRLEVTQSLNVDYCCWIVVACCWVRATQAGFKIT
jgi:hypothetical protein